MADIKNKLALILGFLLFAVAALHTAISYNYEYVNVTSKVNVTNAYPVITSIVVDQSILLNAGTTKLVLCNVSIQDWNGYGDIQSVNASLWDNNVVTFLSPDNPNNHYTNGTCRNVSESGYYANYTCAFDVWYYANNGTNWTCNATVLDKYNLTDAELNKTTILAYYALNVTPTIDFGNMAVGDTKNNVSANITNFGNRNINVSVDGYGAVDGDGLAMRCQIRNITLPNLRYTINESVWASATLLTDSPVNISGLIVPKRTGGMEWNQTYWHLYIPPAENPFGICNGTVVFTAWTAG